MSSDATSNQVREVLDTFPFDEPPLVLLRHEALLLSSPQSLPGPVLPDPTPLEVVHMEYRPGDFAIPRTIYKGVPGLIEWQQMVDFRQPMHHRNLDVDELGFQIQGERTLMTEIGTAELRGGDFCRVPVGVCHDNWGRHESHVLFYIAAPCEDCLPAVRFGDRQLPPFAGWEPKIVNEMHTRVLDAKDVDLAQAIVAVHQADEHLILRGAEDDSRRLSVARVDENVTGTSWVWKAAGLWIGLAVVPPVEGGHVYRRHRNCDEVQFQISGRRTLASHGGAVEIEPGDFVRIPAGYAFSSIADEPNRYLVVNSVEPFERIAEPSKTADVAATLALQAAASGVGQSIEG